LPVSNATALSHPTTVSSTCSHCSHDDIRTPVARRRAAGDQVLGEAGKVEKLAKGKKAGGKVKQRAWLG